MCLCKALGILSKSESHTGTCLIWLLRDLLYRVRFYLHAAWQKEQNNLAQTWGHK
jgi:hypothetical protein